EQHSSVGGDELELQIQVFLVHRSLPLLVGGSGAHSGPPLSAPDPDAVRSLMISRMLPTQRVHASQSHEERYLAKFPMDIPLRAVAAKACQDFRMIQRILALIALSAVAW